MVKWFKVYASFPFLFYVFYYPPIGTQGTLFAHYDNKNLTKGLKSLLKYMPLTIASTVHYVFPYLYSPLSSLGRSNSLLKSVKNINRSI